MANNSRVLFVAIVIAVLGILAGIFFANFEIYKGEKKIPPSRNARKNVYLAADRWLNQTGHPVRVENRGDGGIFVSGTEKTALIFTSSFDKNGYAQLTEWLDSGCSAALFIDSPLTGELTGYFASFGILCSVDGEPEIDDFPEDFPLDDERLTEARLDIDFEFAPADNASSNAALFHWHQYTDGEKEIRDSHMVTIPRGNGKGELTITGIPYFMQSENLAGKDAYEADDADETAENIRLTWFLSGERDDEGQGILIIRSKEASAGDTGYWAYEDESDFFAKLAEEGSIAPVLVSALLVLLVGFWLTLPVFGKLQKEIERPGKPIRERFRAEGLFFKKYNALGAYLAIYAEEVKRRLRKSGLPESAIPAGQAREILSPPVHVHPKQFMDSLNTLYKTLETL